MSTYDIYDENNIPLHKQASYDEVHTKGLWHRGVHIILYTLNGKILMQKRGINLSFHPSEIEISVGGGVDAGEQPEVAILREVREEIGIQLSPEDLTFISVSTYNHRLKNEIKRVHIYNYSALIDEFDVSLISEKDEVEQLFFISKARLRQSLTLHRIKRIGKISGQYAYWKKLLDSIG